MRLTCVLLAFTLLFAIATPVYSASASNATINVCATDLYATVPLCTYWYEDMENQGITPVMSVTNNGFAPISVSGARLITGETAIRGVPCDLMPSGRMEFVLTENPEKTAVPNRAIKLAIVFTFTKTGE